MKASLGAVLLVLGLLSTSNAFAGATLHIGSGYGTSCQTGGCPLYQGEVNNIGVNENGTYVGVSLDIFQNSGGAGDLIDPVLLILGVPNDSATNNILGSDSVLGASIVDGSTLVQTPITFGYGTTQFGLDGAGFEGLMTDGEVYGFLGLGGANDSNSFGNWSEWDLVVNGITATNFGIYVFAFSPASGAGAFGSKDFLDVTTDGIPEGTFAVGYGMDTEGTGYATPFTEAGLADRPVPEPGSLALVALGLAGLIRRRRRRAT